MAAVEVQSLPFSDPPWYGTPDPSELAFLTAVIAR